MSEAVVSPRLNMRQVDFLGMERKFRAFVGGFGSGKTWGGCAATCSHFWEMPRVTAGYFAPSYRQIADIYYPTIEEVAHDWGFRVKVSTSNKEVDFFRGAIYRGTVICRSMDAPSSIVGFKIGHAHVDEIDVLRQDHAKAAYEKIIARMRIKKDGLRNGVDVTTTPEGFRWTYGQFVQQLRLRPELADFFGLVHASTYANGKNLPADYIPSLHQAYPPQLIAAYLQGLFTNLTSGTVYAAYDRTKNGTDERMREGEDLAVGLDFNVQNMTAIVHVVRDGAPMAVRELTKVVDTPAMAKELRERFVDKGHRVTIYPDASGNNTSSKNWTESDITILKRAGLRVDVPNANPAVRARVLAMNGQFLNESGERRYKVNAQLCPTYAEALEKQAYDKNGSPDKSQGFDHATDAGGYFIVNQYPVKRRFVLPGGRYL